MQWESEFKLKQTGSLDMSFEEFVQVYKRDRFPRLRESTIVMKENIIDTKLLQYIAA